MLEGNIAAWTSELTAMLHQVSCNSSSSSTSTGLISCVEDCGLLPIGYDHLCIVERVNGTNHSATDTTNTTNMPYTTLSCRPCDYSGCGINVSLVLNGLESIEGAFLSRISRLRDCNTSFLADVYKKKFLIHL